MTVLDPCQEEIDVVRAKVAKLRAELQRIVPDYADAYDTSGLGIGKGKSKAGAMQIDGGCEVEMHDAASQGGSGESLRPADGQSRAE